MLECFIPAFTGSRASERVGDATMGSYNEAAGVSDHLLPRVVGLVSVLPGINQCGRVNR